MEAISIGLGIMFGGLGVLAGGLGLVLLVGVILAFADGKNDRR